MKTITTTLAALALVALAAACTSELEAGIEGRTITVDLGTKPAYTEPNTDNPATRTNHTTGQWEVGDKVEVTFSFYDAGSSLGTQKQTLTCTAPAQWSAAPAILIAPAKAKEVRATYNYTSAPDPRTGTKEEIGSYAASIPLPTTGTLTMTAPTWIRNSSLMVVKNIPAGSKTEMQYIGTFGSSPIIEWTNNTGAPADANFHMGSSFGKFTLKIDGVSTTMEYLIGKKYIIDANPIAPGTGGTGGGDVQYINVDGSKSGNEIAAIFISAASTNFCITGTATTLATDNTVKDALNNNALVTSGKKINLLMPEVTTVAANAFELCAALETISLPAAESIEYAAFFGCTALTTINLPAAKTIGQDAFSGCAALTTISLPAATSIGFYTFNGCDKLTTVSLPAAESIGDLAFKGCTALKTISLPAATTIEGNAFDDCTALTAVSLPVAKTIGSSVFDDCIALTTISLPAAETIKSNAFYGCKALETVILPAATRIEEFTFSGCDKLTRLELTQSTKTMAVSSSAFGVTTGITLVLNSKATNAAIGVTVDPSDPNKVTFKTTSGGTKAFIFFAVEYKN